MAEAALSLWRKRGVGEGTGAGACATQCGAESESESWEWGYKMWDASRREKGKVIDLKRERECKDVYTTGTMRNIDADVR